MNKKLSLSTLERVSVDEFKVITKNPFVFILDDIRSLNNVGSAFRTGDAFNVEQVYLCGITGTPPHRDIEKTALGATESVAWEHRSNVLALAQELKTAGYVLVAVEQTSNATMLQDFVVDVSKKYAFVFGNEVFGVNDDLINQVDICLEIPQFGTKHSLNVSVSMGIVGWEFIKQHLNAIN